MGNEEYKKLEEKLLEYTRILNEEEAKDRIKEEVEEYVSRIANKQLETEG